MKKILVIRFGSLGDLCVLSWTLTRLANLPGGENRHVTLVTKAAFAPLMSQVVGVDKVLTLENSGFVSLVRLAGQLRKQSWDVVIDAHSILRSNMLLTMIGRIPDSRLRKDTFSRMGLLYVGFRTGALKRTMRQRFDALLKVVPEFENSLPLNSPGNLPLATFYADATNCPQILGIAPGALWPSKRWPPEHFADFLKLLRMQSSIPIQIFLGPSEKVWYSQNPLADIASELADVTIVKDQSLPEIAAALGQCKVVITNDSGLLHIAEATGTPVLAFFGPTVEEFGYFPCLPASKVMQRSLRCRPCSRNGKKPCHRADLACLRDINPSEVVDQTLQMLANGTTTKTEDKS